jgi:hypothetical protein
VDRKENVPKLRKSKNTRRKWNAGMHPSKCMLSKWLVSLVPFRCSYSSFYVLQSTYGAWSAYLEINRKRNCTPCASRKVWEEIWAVRCIFGFDIAR